jgi:hypothetical protein
MAFYLVKAKPKSNIADLRYDIAHGMIHTLIPFGKSLQHILENVRLLDSVSLARGVGFESIRYTWGLLYKIIKLLISYFSCDFLVKLEFG